MHNRTSLSTLVGLLALTVYSGIAYSQDQMVAPCTLGGDIVTGMVVHIDPSTGRPTSRPSPDQSAALAALQASSANRSSEGLVQEVGPTGGVRVNLRNRFRSPLVAVEQENGEVGTAHLACKPAGDAS